MINRDCGAVLSTKGGPWAGQQILWKTWKKICVLFERPVETLLCRIMCSDNEMTTLMPMIGRYFGQADYPLCLPRMGSYRLHDCDSISCKNRLKDNLDYKKRSWASLPHTQNLLSIPLMGILQVAFHACSSCENWKKKKTQLVSTVVALSTMLIIRRDRGQASLPPTQDLLRILLWDHGQIM